MYFGASATNAECEINYLIKLRQNPALKHVKPRIICEKRRNEPIPPSSGLTFEERLVSEAFVNLPHCRVAVSVALV